MFLIMAWLKHLKGNILPTMGQKFTWHPFNLIIHFNTKLLNISSLPSLQCHNFVQAPGQSGKTDNLDCHQYDWLWPLHATDHLHIWHMKKSPLELMLAGPEVCPMQWARTLSYRRAAEQCKALEVCRGRWCKQFLKVHFLVLPVSWLLWHWCWWFFLQVKKEIV